jgi:hypothetical protein
MGEHPTQPEIPAARASSVGHDRNAVFRRQAACRPRDPLATLVEEVVPRHDDPRRDP